MSNDIEVHGLNAFQREMADRFWATDTIDEIETMIQRLPARSLRHQARVALEMMIAATFDQDSLEDLSLAQQVIDKARK
jgi:hypothetical protein